MGSREGKGRYLEGYNCYREYGVRGKEREGREDI